MPILMMSSKWRLGKVVLSHCETSWFEFELSHPLPTSNSFTQSFKADQSGTARTIHLFIMSSHLQLAGLITSCQPFRDLWSLESDELPLSPPPPSPHPLTLLRASRTMHTRFLQVWWHQTSYPPATHLPVNSAPWLCRQAVLGVQFWSWKGNSCFNTSWSLNLWVTSWIQARN